jgi:hypothetical protein
MAIVAAARPSQLWQGCHISAIAGHDIAPGDGREQSLRPPAVRLTVPLTITVRVGQWKLVCSW